MAGLVIASVPVIIVFFFFQRSIMAGLTAGSLRAEPARPPTRPRRALRAGPSVHAPPDRRRSSHLPERTVTWQLFPRPVTADWWRDAAIYQVASRSFADGDGDGTGRPGGRPHRLPYLAELGVDAVWFTPGTSPRWSTAATTWPTTGPSTPPSAPLRREAEKLISEAADLGIRVIIDIVPTTSPTSTPGSGPR